MPTHIRVLERLVREGLLPRPRRHAGDRQQRGKVPRVGTLLRELPARVARAIARGKLVVVARRELKHRTRSRRVEGDPSLCPAHTELVAREGVVSQPRAGHLLGGVAGCNLSGVGPLPLRQVENRYKALVLMALEECVCAAAPHDRRAGLGEEV
eukprot:4125395-Prymnesium_polylepis.1